MEYRVMQKGIRYKVQQRSFLLWWNVEGTFYKIGNAESKIKKLIDAANYNKNEPKKWKEVYRIWNGGK